MASPANKQIWLLRLGLALGVLLAFGPVIHYEFTTYDDPTYVTANPPVQGGVTCQALAWAFTTGHGSNWHPLTWISHMLDCQVFGLNPGGHHLSSLLLHLLNTVLLFTLLQRLTGATWRSALVAALFAWHPLHVESVAWVAERKDVLSATFWLLTLLAYVQYVEGPQPKRYLLTLVLFALGLLSKPMVVTLPFVLLLLDYWPLGRSGARGADKPAVPWSRLAWEKVPFFILAAVSSVVTLGVQKAGGAVATLDDLPFRERSANALLAYGFYLRKVFWPTDLAVFYPLPTALSSWQVIAAGLLLLAVTIAVVICRQSRPYLVVGWFWFLGTLVPVIGLVQVGLQAAADRYTYLPLIGIFILLVWGVADLASRWPQRRLILGGLTTVILGTCLVLTWLQVRTWKNGITLFTHALAVTSNRFVGHNNLARALGNLGRYDEAAVHLKAALEIQPGAPLPLYHLGLIAAREGKLREAMDRYQAALVSQPDYAPAQFELANILASQGNLKEAALHYQACLRTEPDRTEVHHNLAKVLAQLGALSESVDEFKAVLRLDSNQPEAHDELAGV
ncbi:MAG: repeat-containing protein, partial [Pedosphaera sp.]|nr:repeat-containing protein [Pedosphaera sp.]